MSVTVAIPRVDLKYLDGLSTEKIIQDEAMTNALVTVPDSKENVERLVKLLVASKKQNNVVEMFPPLKQLASIILVVVLLSLSSCASLPCGSPKQVQKWEKKTKMRAEIKRLNQDSCFVAKKMAMARRY